MTRAESSLRSRLPAAMFRIMFPTAHGGVMSRQGIVGLAAAFALLVAPVAATAETTALPADAQQALDKGLAAAKQQQWDIAIQNFQEARKIAPDAPEIYYDLGLAESRIAGRELRAVSWF